MALERENGEVNLKLLWKLKFILQPRRVQLRWSQAVYQPPQFHEFRHRLFRRALRSLQWGLQEEPVRSHRTQTSPRGLWIQSRYNLMLNYCLIFSFWQIIYTKHLPMLILLLSFAIEVELDDEDEVHSISFFWFQGKENDVVIPLFFLFYFFSNFSYFNYKLKNIKNIKK